MNIKFTFKKTILLAFSYILLAGLQMINAQTNNVGINTTTPDASAALDVVSTTQGMLVPRMTAAQRGLISSPATGLMVYQSDATAGFYFYNGTAWTQLGATGPQGFQGPQGTQGATGPIGPQGNQGLTGPAGQGVPVGGTTGQVLAKIDATNYNTQWVTTSFTATYPNVEVGVLNNTTQTIPASSSTVASFVDIVFSGTNTGTLTGSNTWNGTTFTVGTAGWYQFNVQLKCVTSTNTETNLGVAYILSIDNSTTANSLMSTYDLNTNLSATPTGLRNGSKINGVVYLTAGQTVRFKGQDWSTNNPTYTSIDNSTSITIIRMK